MFTTVLALFTSCALSFICLITLKYTLIVLCWKYISTFAYQEYVSCTRRNCSGSSFFSISNRHGISV
ncbi:unnamed protein product [Schistosoma mattheei]|uniref:Uncharacterized protein n=1 Tax=Schistosoma mattheei TaxID=31246 RepID=A0AA85AVV0_9TREM|nr:unnamed protein product [Schistosoma mattheei]